MFIHIIKNDFLYRIRSKSLILWMLIFPVVLGAFFKISFGNLYDNAVIFSTIPAAVVETSDNEIFRTVAESVEAEENPLIKFTYTTEDEAKKLLKNKDVKGIIYAGDTISLTVSSDGTEQTILKTFLDRYLISEQIITETLRSNPAAVSDIVSALSSEVNANENIPLTSGNKDPLSDYFFNLIAMVALFGTETGLQATLHSQANLSALGARKCCSPTPKILSLTASLLSGWLVQSLCTAVAVTYVAFILKIDFGSKLPFVYLSGLIGSALGISLGFMIGSVGKAGESKKSGITMAVSLLCCFFSGLMVSNMKSRVESVAPWFNKINPPALISDSFYCLSVYTDYRRYTEKIISMLVLTLIFSAIGFFCTRGRKYASV